LIERVCEMKWKTPGKEDWTNLFKEALRFRDLQSWRFIGNDEIFAVEDPTTGISYFCSVMGAADEFYGLAVYPGIEGLYLLSQTNYQNVIPTEEDIYQLRSFICTYEPWQELLIEEQIQAEKYDPELKHDQMCPGFISYEPGYIPYGLSQNECRLMSLILRQSFNLARQCSQKPNFLNPPSEGQILLRKARKNNEGKLIWRNVWTEYPSYVPYSPVMHIEHYETRNRLNAYTVNPDIQWEIEFLYMPFVIEEGYKPYYPKMLLVADHKTAFVMEPVICNDIELPEKRVLEHFIKLLDHYQCRPSSLIVRSTETMNLFSMVCSELGIALIQSASLPVLDDVKKVLLDNYSQQASHTIH
jgi:hypothetical protein